MEYIHTVTNFIMAGCQPFSIVESPGFRHLFHPFHKGTDKITDVPSNLAREEIVTLRVLAKWATKLEMGAQKRLWAIKHWTNSSDATYTTTT